MQQYFPTLIGDKIVLSDHDLHHLKDVMRVKDHDNIICVIDNKAYLCEYINTKDGYKIDIVKELDRDSELSVEVHLFQAVIKNDNFDLVVQKSAELGVSYLHPTIFKRSVVKVEESKVEKRLLRYNTILKEASQQSKRNIYPECLDYINVKDITLPEGYIGIVPYEKCDLTKTFKELENVIKKSKGVYIVIGPEGGFELNEYETLIKKSFYPVSLGKRILRSETAAITTLSIIDYILEG